MQKNSCYIGTEQRNLCRVLHLNCQNLVLISPPNRGVGVQESEWTPAGVLTNFENRSGDGVFLKEGPE